MFLEVMVVIVNLLMKLVLDIKEIDLEIMKVVFDKVIVVDYKNMILVEVLVNVKVNGVDFVIIGDGEKIKK